MTKKKYMLALVTALSMFLFSCEYKDLVDSEALNAVTIHFDTSKIEEVPGSMRVAFFPVDDMAKANIRKGYTVFDLPRTIWPATVQIPDGIYDIVAWNNDTEHIITDNYSCQSTLYAATAKYRSRGTYDTPAVLDSIFEGQPILDYPDYMVHAIQAEEQIFNKTQTNNVILTPDSMMITVNLKVSGIKGLSWAKHIRGAINNVAGKRYIAYDDHTEDSVVVMFDCSYSSEDSVIYAQFNVFGMEPYEIKNLPHKVVLFFWLETGKVFIPMDASMAIIDDKNQRYHIDMEFPTLNIDLREISSSKNTFDIDVEQWEDVEIEIGF